MDITNWRPLTMLCCDYKMFAKVIANRLQSVLPDIIHADQTGFIRGRQISHNLMELFSTIEYCKKMKIESFLMAIDFEKAFDKTEWSALEILLRKFNFGDNFINLIQTCLMHFENSVSNFGYKSKFGKMTRGLKQGCPLSPYLFDLMIEAVAIKLRFNPNIKRIQINNLHKVLSQFADDIWVISEYDSKSFDTILNVFHSFLGGLLKPPNSIASEKLRLAIWDTSFWTFWVKFGHNGP